MAEDEHGRDPCLRYLETSLRVNPLTMISKRIERGEEVDVAWLFAETESSIARLRDEVDE